MKNKWGTALFVLFCAALLMPAGRQLLAPKNTPERLSPRQEITAKQQVMQQDVAITDELCRSHCAMNFQETVRQLDGAQGTGPQRIKQALEQLQKSHQHMHYLIWTPRGQPLSSGVSVGTIDDVTRKALSSELEKAKSAADRGESYQSPTLNLSGEPFFVMGAPSKNGGSLVGVIHQDILTQVKSHQERNLRITVFPNDKARYGIKAVDPKTLKQVDVDHPEENQGVSHYHKNHVVVKFRSEPSADQLKQMASDIHATNYNKLGYTYVFESKRLETKQMMDYFQAKGVDYVEPHYLYVTNEAEDATGAGTVNATATMVPNDALFSRYQWNLPITHTPQGWNVTQGANAVTVAVVDTGVDLKHPDLQGRLLSGFNAVTKNNAPQDDVGHGTHVAGVISAITNNGLGVAGMTWRNSILPVKVLDNTGAGNTYTVSQGIIWATDHGAKVINLSLGNYAEAQFLHDAIKYAFDRDVAIIAASGNDNTDRPSYPAAYPEVFSVAATDSQNKKASFSNYGSHIAVAAPGVSIASTYPNNQYAALSGTSMASPHVTALAALIRSVNPNLKNTEVYEIMRRSAQDLGDPGRDDYYGYGLIDVNKAVQLASQSTRSLMFQDDLYGREMRNLEQDVARFRNDVPANMGSAQPQSLSQSQLQLKSTQSR